jgi:hydroxymethylglutaryl-CoA synthase
MQPEIGIHGFGAYIPRLRVERAEIAAAYGWLNPGLMSLGKSSRSTCGADEDALTMAAAAARECLAGAERDRVGRLVLGVTTAPFANRSNAGIVAAAAGLGESVMASDTMGSLRAGTTALLQAADSARVGTSVVCVAADRRAARAASTAEMTTGHGAAALLVEPGPGFARLVGAASLSVDFNHQFRAADQEFDYNWEERWVREEGYLKIVPRAVQQLFETAGVAAGDVDHFCMPSPGARVAKSVAARAGISDAAVADDLSAGCGDTGAAHPLLMLVAVLDKAQPGERILVVGFGHGADALLFEVTEGIEIYRSHRHGVGRWLSLGVPCSYPRYLTLNGMLDVEYGIRSEADKSTAMTAHQRHLDLVLHLGGGRCQRCGTRQIPRARICVNPDCRAVDSQEPYSFADSTARVATWSADNLTFTPDPPAYYGLVDFDEGGRLMMDFADVTAGAVEVGTPMQMVFRVRDRDSARGFTRYYWKAAPMTAEEAD